VSRAELLYFEKYKQLEAEGVFADGREQYLLSALCRAYIFYLSSKGGSADELLAWFSCPPAVQMRMPTEEELQKIEEQKVETDQKAYQGLLALCQAQGVQVKTMTREEYLRRKNDVY